MHEPLRPLDYQQPDRVTDTHARHDSENAQHVMLRHVSKLFATLLLTVSAALFIAMSALAGPGIKASAGNTSQKKDTAAVSRESNLSLRIYELFDYLGTDYGLPENAYAMDVVATFEECDDGSRYVTAMNIGGWIYRLDSNCENRRYRGAISVDMGEPIERTVHDSTVWTTSVPAAGGRRSAKATVICNASSWNCTTNFAPSAPEVPDSTKRTEEDGND